MMKTSHLWDRNDWMAPPFMDGIVRRGYQLTRRV
jgi:hypothetical protein